MPIKQEKDQLKIGIILNYLNMGLGNLIPVFYTPIMLSLLGQSEYGLYKLSSSVTSYLSLISLGIGSALTRYLIQSRIKEGKDGEERILGLFLTIFRLIAAAAFIVGMFMIGSLDIWYGASLTPVQLDRMRVIVFILVCNMSISFAMSPYFSVVTAHERFLFLQTAGICSTCLGPILNLVALFLGFSSIGMVTATLALNTALQYIHYIYTRKALGLKAQYKKMPVHYLKDILVFSFWIFVANIAGQLYNATDTVMIGMIPALATVGVAIYNVGGVFNSIFFSLTTGVSSLLAPKANKMVFSGSSNEELTDMCIRVGRIQAYIAALIVSGFIAFGQPFIEFYAGSGYKEAYWVALFMMVPNTIPLVQGMCLSIIVAQNRHRFRSIVYLIIAVLNVIGTWVLIHRWGIIGAALMTGVALIIGQGFLMNWYYQHRTGLNILRFWRNIGPIFVLPATMSLGTLFLSHIVDFYQPLALFIGIIVYTLIFVFLNWKFIMNPYERELCTGPLRVLIQKYKR